MFKKTIVGAFVLLFVGCNAAKHDTQIHKEQRVPPYRVSSAEFVSPSQPCPQGLCAIPTDLHSLETDYMCETCEFISEAKGDEVGRDVLASACPEGMALVDGDYCPVVQQRCLYMVDSYGNRTKEPVDPNGRCGEWENPVKCVSKKIHKSVCVDVYEYPNKKGAIPQDWMSWYDAKNACEAEGKRLCTRSEATFAAEGPNMHPLPYGDGFHRDRTICNFDNHVKDIGITGADVMSVSDPNSDTAKKLRSLLVPSGSKEMCVSEWGVHDQSGGVDEWVENETRKPYVSGLMFGHVFGVRCASRPMTDVHGPSFRWYESGTRCCLTP
jgi:formylglycine-generating enzyme